MEQMINFYLESTELKNYSDIQLDLGCGEGSFTLQLAQKYPDSLIIGVDTMKSRLRKLNAKIAKHGLKNIILVNSEAFFFIKVFASDLRFSAIHLLCPDPWPKRKHRFHRLLSSEFTYWISRKLNEKGIFHFSSDDISYCETAQRIFASSPDFILIKNHETEGVKSDFEMQWLSEGKIVRHLFWEKR